jgi:hypothetical protein
MNPLTFSVPVDLGESDFQDLDSAFLLSVRAEAAIMPGMKSTSNSAASQQ